MNKDITCCTCKKLPTFQVYVKAVDNSYGVDTNLYGQPDEVYSTFSGYLIAPIYEEIPTVG